jgi:alkylhydroperoxidase family enzyme
MDASTMPEPVDFHPADIDQWYQSRFLRPSLVGRLLGPFFGAALRDPKIFDVLKRRPRYRFAAIDAWRRAMWHKEGLSRRTREAIAVSVSLANQCLY